jgi:hypothetical protein
MWPHDRSSGDNVVRTEDRRWFAPPRRLSPSLKQLHESFQKIRFRVPPHRKILKDFPSLVAIVLSKEISLLYHRSS